MPYKSTPIFPWTLITQLICLIIYNLIDRSFMNNWVDLIFSLLLIGTITFVAIKGLHLITDVRTYLNNIEFGRQTQEMNERLDRIWDRI